MLPQQDWQLDLLILNLSILSLLIFIICSIRSLEEVLNLAQQNCKYVVFKWRVLSRVKQNIFLFEFFMVQSIEQIRLLTISLAL